MRRLRRRAARWRRGRLAPFAALLAAALLAIGGGYGIGFLATRPQPVATPTPTLVAASEEPTPSPTPTPTPSPSPTPTATPSATPSPTAAPTPRRTLLPPPTPRPTPRLASGPGVVGIRLLDVGLDHASMATRRARSIGFTTDRSGPVTATLSGTSGGPVEVCLVRAAPGQTPRPGSDAGQVCRELREGSVGGAAPSEAQEWTVTLTSASGTRALTDLTLRFPASTAAVELVDFRFDAVERIYNGVTAEFITSDSGTIRLTASWVDQDADSTHDFRLTMSDVTGADTTLYRKTSTGSEVDARTAVRADRRVRIRLENRDTTASNVFLAGTLSWP